MKAGERSSCVTFILVTTAELGIWAVTFQGYYWRMEEYQTSAG